MTDASLWGVTAVGGLGVGAIFASLAHSLHDVTRGALEQLSAERAPRGRSRTIERILDDLEGHATAVSFPRVVCNLVVAVAMVGWLASLSGRTAPRWFELALGVLVGAVLIWIFGLALPRAIARHAAAKTVYAWAGVIRGAYVVTRPLRAVARFLDEVVRRLAGPDPTPPGEALAQELISVVEESSEEGAADDLERSMLGAVARFREKAVAQIMTPRIDMEALEVSSDLGAVTAFLRSGAHSRVPVYEDTLDRIVGVFYVKDLLKWLAGEGSRGGRTFALRGLLRPAVFVPETKTIRELLGEFLEKRVHLAIVADEFGGTSGLVTIEDVMEEIVGEIHDEHEAPEDAPPEIHVRPDARAAEVDARAYIEDVNRELGSLGVEVPRGDGYDTMGGFVTVTLGEIPTVGQIVERGGVRVTVLEAEPTRVVRVRVEAMEPAPAEEPPMPPEPGPGVDVPRRDAEPAA